MSLDEGSLLENISYHCMHESRIGNPWLICERMVQEVFWPRLSLCKDTKLSHFSLSLALFKCWSSFLSSSISSALVSLSLCPECVSWLSEHLFFLPCLFLNRCQRMAGCADKVRGKETNIFEPCYMPGTVSWQDFSYSPDRDK